MQKPSLSLIAAMDKNQLIGNNNQLPWHLSADLKYFKKTTMGKPVLMGRKTFFSIGKPLLGRQNIVLTRDQSFVTNHEVDVVHSLAEALAIANKNEEIMVIGGAEIFTACLPFAKRLYLTVIQHEFVGDTYFPDFSLKEWHPISSEHYQPDEMNQYPYSFIVLEKN